MKRAIFLILAVSVVSFTSCKKINQMFGKSSMSQEEVDAIVAQNDQLQKQIKEDAAAYQRELDALRAEYEQKIAAMESTSPKPGVKAFYVVVGSFKDQKLADAYSAKMKAAGFEGNIVDGPGEFKLITYSTHPSLKEALSSLKNARTSVETSWIYFN